jgi:predicted anti-sigma-YlaC factor YlaD
MKCDDVRKLISEAPLGDPRASGVEAHIANCPDCAAELRAMRKTVQLVESVEPIEPPAGLWNCVRNAIGEPVQPRSAPARWNAVWQTGIACVALAALILFASPHQHPITESYAFGSFMNGHVEYASRDALSDPVALGSVATISYREQAGGAIR